MKAPAAIQHLAHWQVCFHLSRFKARTELFYVTLHLRLPGLHSKKTCPPHAPSSPVHLTSSPHAHAYTHTHLLLLSLFGRSPLSYSMHNSFRVAVFSPSLLLWESAPFFLFDFTVSREAVPRAFFMFLTSTDIKVVRGGFLCVCGGLCIQAFARVSSWISWTHS